MSINTCNRLDDLSVSTSACIRTEKIEIYRTHEFENNEKQLELGSKYDRTLDQRVIITEPYNMKNIMIVVKKTL